jgi:hypothetical protein
VAIKHSRIPLRLQLGFAFLWALVVTFTRPGLAWDYHPLELGWEWYYENALSETEHISITGQREVLGTMTVVRRHEVVSQLPQVFENFWSKDVDGNLFLHGAINYSYPIELAYIPPLRIVDAPLFLHKAWTTEGVHTFDLSGTPIGGPFDYPLRVYFEGDTQVPAGTFYAYGIGFDILSQVTSYGREVRFDVFGRRVESPIPTDDGDITEWYTDGLGLIQHTASTIEERIFKLHWWNSAVPIVPETWGRIKSNYR